MAAVDQIKEHRQLSTMKRQTCRELWLTVLLSQVTILVPQSWVSHETPVTNAPPPVRSVPTTERRGKKPPLQRLRLFSWHYQGEEG